MLIEAAVDDSGQVVVIVIDFSVEASKVFGLATGIAGGL